PPLSPVPQPPPSPPFPYTPLFRSRGQIHQSLHGVGHVRSASRIAPSSLGLRSLWAWENDAPFRPVRCNLLNPKIAIFFTSRLPLDRKSTRLNSSHVAISYAVFCLK